MLKIKNHFNLAPEQYDKLRAGHLEARREELVRSYLRCGASTITSVLEIGSGTGSTLAALADEFEDKEFLGIDIMTEMVEYAQRTYGTANVRFRHVDITSNRLDRAYDFAYSIDMIHHVKDHPTFFRSVRNNLRDGAAWPAIEPNIFHPYIFAKQEQMRRSGYDEDHFRPWKLEPELKMAEFTIQSRGYAFALPGFIKQPPAILRRIENAVERFRFLGGSVVYELVAS